MATASQNLTAILEELPNPFTDLAFLPPNLAFQVQLSRYIFVGTLGAALWDHLSNLHLEFRMLTGKVTLLKLAYFLSRTASLLFIVAGAVGETAPIGNCHRVEKLLPILYCLSFTFTGLLFFFRVRVVFHTVQWVHYAFFLLWLGVVGSQIYGVFGVGTNNLGPTKYCITTGVQDYVFFATLFVCIYDTLVFLAISYRLIHNAPASDFNARGRMKTLTYGDYLPAISKMLYLDGQMYFLFTIGFSISVVALGYTTNLAPPYRVMLTPTNVFVTSSMACRIVRNARISVADAATTSGSLPFALRNHHSTGGVTNEMYIMSRAPPSKGVGVMVSTLIVEDKSDEYVPHYPETK